MSPSSSVTLRRAARGSSANVWEHVQTPVNLLSSPFSTRCPDRGGTCTPGSGGHVGPPLRSPRTPHGESERWGALGSLARRLPPRTAEVPAGTGRQSHCHQPASVSPAKGRTNDWTEQNSPETNPQKRSQGASDEGASRLREGRGGQPPHGSCGDTCTSVSPQTLSGDGSQPSGPTAAL